MKQDEIVKTGILILFAGLVTYMVVAETQTATVWIAFFAPIFLAYLFKPSSSKEEKEQTVESNKLPNDSQSGSDMGSSGLHRIILSIWNSVVQRQPNRRTCTA